MEANNSLSNSVNAVWTTNDVEACLNTGIVYDYNYCWPRTHTVYTTVEPNKTEQAVSVVKALIKSGKVEIRTAKQFIEILDEIKKAL